MPESYLARAKVNYGDRNLSAQPVMPLANLDMGRMAVSIAGATNLYSGGFAGCLGVVIIPSNGRGGMTSHIHQMWALLNRQAFLTEAVNASIDVATETWPTTSFIDVVMFRGELVDGGPEFPGLVDVVQGRDEVNKVVDLRCANPDTIGDQMMYDTARQVVYIWGGAPTVGLGAFMDWFDPPPPAVQAIEQRQIVAANRAMPVHRYG